MKMLDRKVAEKVYEDYYGFYPNQEDLELWLYKQAETLDKQMLAATGLDVDVLQFQKNALAELLDAIAFGYPI